MLCYSFSCLSVGEIFAKTKTMIDGIALAEGLANCISKTLVLAERLTNGCNDTLLLHSLIMLRHHTVIANYLRLCFEIESVHKFLFERQKSK
jgi:hypothetical protein